MKRELKDEDVYRRPIDVDYPRNLMKRELKGGPEMGSRRKRLRANLMKRELKD